MKKLHSFVFIFSISLMAFSQSNDLDRIEFKYCEYLGYELKYQENTGKFVVVLPNGENVNPRQFYLGKVGQEYSYCALKGYETRPKGVENWESTHRYPVCFKEKNGKIKKEIYLLSLMYQEGDYSSLFDVDETPELPPLVPYYPPIDVSVGNPSVRSPMTPFDWRDRSGKDYVTEYMENQGASYMCYAVSSGFVAESAYNVAVDAYNNSDEMRDLSTGYIAFCGKACDSSKINGYYGQGGYDYNLYPLEFVYNNGITSEDDQFTDFSIYGVCGTLQQGYDRTFFAGWGTVGSSTSAIKSAIINYGPVLASIWQTSKWSTYDPDTTSLESLIIVDSVAEPCGYYRDGFHSISIVGWGFYDDDESPADGLYWIVRNTRGDEWGYKGYAYIHEYSLKIQCQVGYLDGDQPYIDRTYVEDDSGNRTISLEDEFPTADDIEWTVTPTSVFNSPYAGSTSSASVDTDPPAGAGQRGYIEFEITMEDLCIGNDKTVTVKDSIWIGKPETPDILGTYSVGCSVNYDFEIDEDYLEGSEWYIWSTSSNITLTSSDSTSSECTITPNAGGNGWVKVESYNDNGYTEDTYYVMVTCMGLLIYPNPASQELTVEIADESLENSYQVEIINSTGEKKKTKTGKSKRVVFNVTDLDNGNYLVNLKAFNKHGKFIGQKSSHVIIN